jgi:hypothetical protein
MMWRGNWMPLIEQLATAHHKSEIPNHKSLIPRLPPEVVARKRV